MAEEEVTVISHPAVVLLEVVASVVLAEGVLEVEEREAVGRTIT